MIILFFNNQVLFQVFSLSEDSDIVSNLTCNYMACDRDIPYNNCIKHPVAFHFTKGGIV